jgi:hypothetical protein
MRSRWTALLAVLFLAVLTPRSSDAQAGPPQTQQRTTGNKGGLKQNYPNPFNPETTIPFTVGDFPACTDQSRRYLVSLRVKNALAQTVALPVLQGGSNDVAGGQRLNRLSLPCGEYRAYWDGKYLNTRQEVASGVYVAELEVDGYRQSKKMLVTK